MKNKFITYNYSAFHYSESENTGKPKLLMFAGYGQDNSIFDSWEKHFPDFQLITLDLFGHGKTEWKHNDEPSMEDWQKIIKEITNNEPFSILAYSIGAAPALALLEKFSNKINKIILIAPTGIDNDNFYHFSVNTALGRGMFKRYVKHGNKLNFIYSLMGNLKLINKKFKAFLVLKTSTKDLRETLMRRWVLLRKLSIPPKKAIQIINKNKIQVMIIAGEHDVVVKPKSIKFFTKKIDYVFLYWVNADHHLLRNPVNISIIEKIKTWL